MFCLNKFVFSPNRSLKWEGLRRAQLGNTCRMCVKAFVGSSVAVGFFVHLWGGFVLLFSGGRRQLTLQSGWGVCGYPEALACNLVCTG